MVELAIHLEDGVAVHPLDEFDIANHEPLTFGLVQQNFALQQGIQSLLLEIESAGQILGETVLIEPSVKIRQVAIGELKLTQRYAPAANGCHRRVRTAGAPPSPIEEDGGHKGNDHSPEHSFDDRRLGPPNGIKHRRRVPPFHQMMRISLQHTSSWLMFILRVAPRKHKSHEAHSHLDHQNSVARSGAISLEWDYSAGRWFLVFLTAFRTSEI
jgi:hypothetical protein